MRLWHRLFKHAASSPRRHPLRSRCRPAVEGLEQRSLPTVTLPTPGVPGAAKITGSAGPDQLLVRLQPGSPTNIQLSDNGGASFGTAALSDVTSIAVSGLGGADTLTIDHSNGFVARVGFLPIIFDGGPGRDTLIQQGNTNLVGLNQTYFIGGNSDEGRLDTTNGTLSNSISFSQLNAIIDVMNTLGLTLNLNDQNNVVKVERDRSYGGFNTMKLEGVDQQGRNDPIDLVLEERPTGDRKSSSVDSFVPITLANKINVTVNGLGGDDLFTLDHSRLTTTLANLTFDGGTGNDRLYSDNAPRGATLNTISIEKNLPDGLDDAFLTELYLTRVKRSPAESEVESWKNVIKNGATRAQIVSGVERAVESRRRQVHGWYEQYLARSASGNEEQGWVTALAGGTTEEIILAGILGSKEYYDRAQTLVGSGSANERFLQSLYTGLMGRGPGANELNAWLALTTSSNRGTVALTFMVSPEFRGRVIDAYYTTFLQRDADAAGRQGWVASSQDLTQVREGFASSIEFYDLNHASATTLQLNQGQTVFTGQTSNPNDKLYWILTAPRDGTLSITVQTTNNRFPKLQAEDSSGRAIFETEPRDNRNSGNIPLKAGQANYFRLRAVDGNLSVFNVTLRLT